MTYYSRMQAVACAPVVTRLLRSTNRRTAPAASRARRPRADAACAANLLPGERTVPDRRRAPVSGAVRRRDSARRVTAPVPTAFASAPAIRTIHVDRPTPRNPFDVCPLLETSADDHGGSAHDMHELLHVLGIDPDGH